MKTSNDTNTLKPGLLLIIPDRLGPPIGWVIAEDLGTGWLCLVPADDYSKHDGPEDVGILIGEAKEPHTLRCGLEVRVDAHVLTKAKITDRLSERDLARTQEKLLQIRAGTLRPSLQKEENAATPEYEEEINDATRAQWALLALAEQYCKCYQPLSLKRAVGDLLDEIWEFCKHPSRDELSDCMFAVGRLAAAFFRKTYFPMPLDGRHRHKIGQRMRKYGCIRSEKHLKDDHCPSIRTNPT